MARISAKEALERFKREKKQASEKPIVSGRNGTSTVQRSSVPRSLVDTVAMADNSVAEATRQDALDAYINSRARSYRRGSMDVNSAPIGQGAINRPMTVSGSLVNRVARNADNGVAGITRKYAIEGSAPKDTSFMTDNLAAREASRRNEQREMAAQGKAEAKRYDIARRAEMYQKRYKEDLHRKDEKGNIEAYKYMYDAKLPDETGIPFEFGGQKGTIQLPRIVEMFTDPELNKAKSLPYNMMTEGEKDIYRYTLGKYGQAAATDYLETLEESLNQRLNDRNYALNEYIASKHPVVGAATNVLAGYPSSIMGYGAVIKNTLSEDKISPNDPLLRGTVIQEATQAGVQNAARKAVNAEEGSTKAAISDFLVGTGLSALNSVSQVHTLPEPLVLASFSGNAMGSSVRKTSADPNSSKNQTTATALAQGIAESFFERFSIENLKAMRVMPPTTVKGILKAFLKQGVTEGSEEVATEGANILSDIVINGDNSEAGQRYKANLEAGMDETTALANTLSSLGQDVALAGLGGFISGGFTSGADIAIGTYQGGKQLQRNANNYRGESSNLYQDIADSIDTSTPEGERAKALAEEMSDRISNGETISTMDNGFLNNAIDEAIAASQGLTEIVPEGETIIEPDHDIVSQDDTMPVEGSSTVQSDVNDVVNAAVDELIRQQQEDIDTSESTPDEAKKQTETLVNDIQEEGTPEIEFNSKKLDKNSIDDVSQETQNDAEENKNTVSDTPEYNDSVSETQESEKNTGKVPSVTYTPGEVITGKISSDEIRDRLSHVSRFTADNIEYEIANDDGGYRGYMRDTSGDRFGGAITDSRSLRYSTDRKESWQDAIDDLVNVARNNGFTSDTVNSSDKLREIAEDNLKSDAAANETESYNMLSDLRSRSDTRFSSDPAAKSVYDEGFRQYYDYFETDVADNNPDIVVRTYDENMAKAYDLGLQGKSMLEASNDEAFGNFVLKFDDLADKMWKAGYNKGIETRGGNENEKSDINRGSVPGQTESTVLGSVGQVSDEGTGEGNATLEVRQGTSEGNDGIYSEETGEAGRREDTVQSSDELQSEDAGDLHAVPGPGDGRGSGDGVREGDQVRSDEQRPRGDERGIENTEDNIEPSTPEEEVQKKDEIASQEKPKGNNFVLTPEFNKTIPRTSATRRDANVLAIKTLENILTEDRIATPEEQEALARFTGWGGINDADFKKAKKALENVLSQEELEAAEHETLSAYYTSPEIIGAMYKGIAGLGFKGGRLLEPSCGTGRFIGCMPGEMIPSVKRWTAVELSHVPGNIARLLYPNADVRVQGFETVNVLDNFNDVVIGNVPFGSGAIVDKKYPKFVYSKLHNYFIARSLDKTRPGGLCVLITSSTTMDDSDPDFRNYVKKKADLIGAIRLPNTAFGDTGTNVISDILVFKKRSEGMPYEGEAFSSTIYNRDLGRSFNEYFANHPDMILGKLKKGDNFRQPVTVEATSGKLSDKIEKAFSKITGRMEYTGRDYEAERTRREADNKKKGTAYERDGQLYINKDGEEVLATEYNKNLTEKNLSIYKDCMSIRDTARALLDSQRKGDEKATTDLRKELNEKYDAFVKNNPGGFHRKLVAQILAADTDYAFLQSLEKVTSKDGKTTIEKNDIFFINTLNNPVDLTHVDNLSDGIEASLGKVGYIDTSYISELWGKNTAEVEKELDKGTLAFRDADGNFIPSNLYLSGNVRAKLKEAEALAESDKKYEKNVKALKKVQPRFVHGDEIKAHVGASWIPEEYYSEFAESLLNVGKGSIKVHYVRGAGYDVSSDSRARYSAENTSVWGNKEMPFLYENQNTPGLLWNMLNNRNIEVKYTYKDSEGGTHTEHDLKAEAQLRDLKRKINDELNSWLWKDKDRADKLENLFNDTFNANVEAQFSDKVTINGQSPLITLRDHQAKLVNRVAFSPYNTLAQHGVGAGKTFGAIASLMKMKQLGMIAKPVIVVPKNKIQDWQGDFYKLFPGANVLVADSNTFLEKKRKEFVNKIATTDCDAVIISYEQFKMIPMTPEYQLEYNKRELAKIKESIEDEGGTLKNGKYSFRNGSKTTRQLQQLIDKIEAEINALENFKKDENNIFFEETGIDYICVDEAQNYKNLMYFTNLSGVADMGNPTGSQRAKDMKTKCDYVRKMQQGKGVLFLTATPIMNSPVEAYTQLRYLADEELEKKGIRTLDDFISLFGEIEDITRQDNAGRSWVTKTSFTGFCNLPQWTSLWRTYVDRVKTSDIPNVKLPKIAGGKEEIITCQAGPMAREVINGLADRLKNVSREGQNHVFAIQSDGKKASMTQRFFDESLPYGPEEKIPMAVNEIYKEYMDTKTFKDWDGKEHDNGVQLVFCDFGTPKSKAKTKNQSDDGSVVSDDADLRGNLNIYEDMRNMLVEKGIPANEIAFIQEYKGDENKATKLYDDVRAGRVRVLIGSTVTMAEGLNVQDRITCLHLMNPFMRPGDKEQAVGRGIRQKNMNPEVKIKIYVTEDTFDTKQWDNLRAKGNFINQIQDGVDIGNAVNMNFTDAMSAADIMAIASGNPLLKTQSEANDRINKLNLLKDAYHSKQYQMQNDIRKAEAENERYREAIENTKKDIKRAKDISGDNFKAVVAGKQYTNREQFGTDLLKYVKKYLNDKAYEDASTRKIGSIAGFDIVASKSLLQGELELKGDSVGYVSVPVTNGTIDVSKASGMASRFQNTIKGYPKKVESAEQKVKLNEENISKWKEELKAPFEQAKELSEMTKLSEDIETALKSNDESTYGELNKRYADLNSKFKDVAYSISKSKGGIAKNAEKPTKREKAEMAKAANEEREKKRKEFEDSLRPDKWTAEKNEGSDATVENFENVIGQFAHDMYFQYTPGKRYTKGKSISGFYSYTDKGIRTKIANDFPAFCHENGHLIADRIDLNNQSLDAYDIKYPGLKADILKAYSAEYDEDDYPADKHLSEGIAEFFRHYCENKDTARIDYPVLTDFFLKKLGARDLALVNTFADKVNAIYAAGASEITQHVVRQEDSLGDYRTLREKGHDAYVRAQIYGVDSNYGMKDFDYTYGTNIHQRATNAEYIDGTIAYAIENDLYDLEGNYIGPGLKRCYEGVNLDPKSQEFMDFGDYLVVRHAPERLALGLRTYADDRQNNIKWMQERKAELDAKYPHFANAAERGDRFQKNLLENYALKYGLITKDAYKKMLKDYPHYVPFFRVGFKNKGDALKKVKGSGRTIINPVDNIITSTMKMMKAASQQAIKLEMRNAALQNNADALFLEKMPEPQVAQKFDMRGIKESLHNKIADINISQGVDPETQDLLHDMVDNIENTLVQFETGRARKDLNEIVIMVEGKPEFWKINDENLFLSLTSMDYRSANMLVNIYGKLTRFMTSNTTGNNFIWSIFSNSPRDFQTLLNYSDTKNVFNLVKLIGDSYIQSAKSATGLGTVSDYYAEFLAMGAKGSPVWAGSKSYVKDMRKLLNTKKGFDPSYLNPLKYARFISETIEMGPRYATYRLMRERGMNPQEAFYKAMDITTNFRKKGILGKEFNKTVQFFNANVQGLDHAIRYYSAEDLKGKPTRNKAIRARMTFLVATSLLTALLQFAANHLDDDDKEEYNRLSNYMKNYYFCIHRGDGKFIRIPKNHELSVLESLFERSLEYYRDENKFAFDEYFDYFAEQVMPPVISELAEFPAHAFTKGAQPAIDDLWLGIAANTGVYGVAMQTAMNKNYMGSPIVKKSLEGLAPKMQYDNKTTQLAYLIGQALNISPKKLDHFAENVLGYIWDTQGALFPINAGEVKGERDLAFGVSKKYTTDNLRSNDISNWIYDKAAESQMQLKSGEDNLLEASLDQYMKTRYANYDVLWKNEEETEENRKERKEVLDELVDYRKGKTGNDLSMVSSLVEETGDKSYLPSALDTTFKNGKGGETVSLTSSEYREYQTTYEDLYIKFMNESITKGEPLEKWEITKKKAQDAAKNQAMDEMLKKKGIESKIDSKAYDFVSSTNDFDLYADAAYDIQNIQDKYKDDKKKKQQKVADYIRHEAKSDSTRKKLWELAGYTVSEKSYGKYF